MTAALVRLTIPMLNPLVDSTSVSLHYTDDGDTNFQDLADNCSGLFNSTGAGAANPLCHYISDQADRNTNHCRVDVYDITAHLNGSPHGSPVATAQWTLGAGLGATDMPEGLAACISYRADYGTDVEFSGPRAEGAGGTRPRARDRNRLYIGPLHLGAFSTPGSGARVAFTAAFITDCLNNLKQMEVVTSSGFVPTIPPNQWNMVVWSRKNASVKPVAEFWMDDRPDYQRRRSDQPGTRTFLSA